MIDYELARREGPKLKAELTRAQKKGYVAVLVACRHAVARWEVWGAWPDNWSRWQRALGDSAFDYVRETHKQPMIFRLEEL